MTQSFDYIIVGAGSAGCVLANRLTEDGRNSVLLIEAGSADNNVFHAMPLGFMAGMSNPETDWGYRTEPEPNLGGRQINLPRGRILGGCSTTNGMIYMRGNALDYDEWRDLGCTGWGHADVLPYFRRMETSWREADQYHGAEGPLSVNKVPGEHLLSDTIMQSAVAAGYKQSDDLSGAMQEGVSACEVTVDKNGRRASTSKAYLRPALGRHNLTLISEALVSRVLFEGKRAIGVEYTRGMVTERALANTEVILSGGSYNSPQLLMLSGIGPAAHLQAHGIKVVHDSPGVGQNLSEHPVLYAEFAAKPVTFLKQLRFDRATLSVLQWAFLGTGPFASQITSAAMMLRTTPELTRPDIQLMFLPIRLDGKIWFPGMSKKLEDLFSIMIIQLHPQSRGSLELRSADPREKPVIRLNLLSHERDYAELRRGIAAVRSVFAAKPVADLTTRETKPGADKQSDAALDEWIRQNLNITQHPVGTCSMGIGPSAVVDPSLRVIGVEGLRVADASIMPTVPGGNTNAPVIMIAEKAADLIRDQRPAAHRAAALKGVPA